MSELTPTITKAVETWAAKLLAHFKAQYGSAYFTPLGVNDKTPGEIAPIVAPSIEEQILVVQGDKVTINVIDDKVGTVFDAFMNDFFNSLSFIGKTAMKATWMKMSWNDFVTQLADRKANNPDGYNTWKSNWIMVLHTLFDEVVAALQANWKEVFISNGEKYYSNSEEAVAGMKIFS